MCIQLEESISKDNRPEILPFILNVLSLESEDQELLFETTMALRRDLIPHRIIGFSMRNKIIFAINEKLANVYADSRREDFLELRICNCLEVS